MNIGRFRWNTNFRIDPPGILNLLPIRVDQQDSYFDYAVYLLRCPSSLKV